MRETIEDKSVHGVTEHAALHLSGEVLIGQQRGSPARQGSHRNLNMGLLNNNIRTLNMGLINNILLNVGGVFQLWIWIER